MSRYVLGALALISGLAFARPASALDFEASAHLGYGVAVNDNGSPLDPYGFGVGARAGVGLSGLRLGAALTYFLGSGVDGLDGTGASTLHVAGEVGYDISLPALPLTVRPRVGLGLVSQSFDFGLTDGDFQSFAVSPGLSVRYSILPMLFAGLEAEVIVPTEALESNIKAVNIGLSVGASF